MVKSTVSGARIVCSAMAISASILSAPNVAAQAHFADPQRSTAATVPSSEDLQSQNEIVVTASKREERLQDAPGAISALSADSVEKLGVTSFRDYATLVPGLSQREIGQPGRGTIILRGLNSGPQQTTNTTAYYIDDAPFSTSGYLGQGGQLTPEPELAEVERIEVLKGPQGTLYGASSLGGLIHVVTKKPDTTSFFGRARTEINTVDGGGTGYLVRGFVNVPIAEDVAAISATGYYRRIAGFVDNVFTGSENVDHSNIAGGRIALLVAPANGLTINVSGQYQKINTNAGTMVDTVPGTLTPRSGRYGYSNFQDFGGYAEYRLINGTIDYETDFGTFTAAGSYADYEVGTHTDGTRIYIPAGRGFLNAPVSSADPRTRAVAFFGRTTDELLPADTLASGFFRPQSEKYSAELRFASKRLGPVEFLAGAFYTHENSTYLANIYPYSTPTTPFAAPFDTLVRTTTTSRYKEVAGFGNLTFYVSDNFDVTGGIRYAHNEQLSGTGGPGGLTYFTPRTPLTFPIKENATTYLATARWRPSRFISFYARAASGYRPGGPQTNPNPPIGAQTVISSDSVWNYEAGVKGTTPDGAFSYDVSVYHIDWKDIQLNTLFNGIVLGGNAASATVDGFEAQFIARPNHLLTFNANVGYTSPKIKNIDPGAAAVSGARTGDRLPLSPTWKIALTADHAIPLSDQVVGNIGATLRFQSDMAATFPALDPRPTNKLPEITTLDFRAAVTLYERVTVTARVDNAFNAFRFTNYDYTANNGVVLRPRTFSLGVGVDF